MKKVTENAIESRFMGNAIVDKIRDTKSSHLLEQININKEFRSPLTPAMLYNYYMSICLIRTYDLTKDWLVGKQIGYPTKTVGNVRRKLVKGGWIHFDKFTHKGKTYGQWFLGKDVVTAYKTKEGNLSLKEQLTLGVITEEDYRLATSLSPEGLPF